MMRKDRVPAFALWLLRKFGSRAYRESLAGDLIEAFGRGRGRMWVWREVLHAISAAVMPRSPFVGWLSAIKGVILAVGLIMLGAATFSWAASLTEESPSSVSREP
jgi:hypothetical protein